MSTMTERERSIRIAQALADEAATGTMGWWWLSFADASLPRGEQFLGGCVVRAMGMGTAVRESHRLGINPGGEVRGMAFPASIEPPSPFFRYRLLTREECAAMDVEMTIAAARPGGL